MNIVSILEKDSIELVNIINNETKVVDSSVQPSTSGLENFISQGSFISPSVISTNIPQLPENTANLFVDNQETKNTSNETKVVDSSAQPSTSGLENFISQRSFISPSVISTNIPQLPDDPSKLFVVLPQPTFVNPDPETYLDKMSESPYFEQINQTISFAQNPIILPSFNQSEKTLRKNKISLLYKSVKAQYLARVKKLRNEEFRPGWNLQDKWHHLSKDLQKQYTTGRQRQNKINGENFEQSTKVSLKDNIIDKDEVDEEKIQENFNVFLSLMDRYNSESNNPVQKNFLKNESERMNEQTGCFPCLKRKNKIENEPVTVNNGTVENDTIEKDAGQEENNNFSKFEKMMVAHEEYNRNLAVMLKKAEKREYDKNEVERIEREMREAEIREAELKGIKLSEKILSEEEIKTKNEDDYFAELLVLLDKHNKITSRFILKTE